MRVMVMSPHRDDAAFSCGLMLNGLVSAGADVTIVNVCTISRYAPYLEEDTRDRESHVTETRRVEDLAFVDLLTQNTGAQRDRIELLDLSWEDVPLRWYTADDQALAPRALPRAEIDAMVEAFRALPTHDLVLAPLALGGHVDHRLVRNAAEQAFNASSLVFYEDLPYACRMTADDLKAATVEDGPGLSEAWLGHRGLSGLKRTYALCYPSQVATDVADEMEQYAQRHSGRERFVAAPTALLKLRTALQPGVSAE